MTDASPSSSGNLLSHEKGGSCHYRLSLRWTRLPILERLPCERSFMKVVFGRRRFKKVAFASFLGWNLPFSSRYCPSLRWTWVPPWYPPAKRETFFGSSTSTQGWSKVAVASFLGLQWASSSWHCFSLRWTRVPPGIRPRRETFLGSLFLRGVVKDGVHVFPWIDVAACIFLWWTCVHPLFRQLSGGAFQWSSVLASALSSFLGL